jgi:tetratricopeptide (TPR) repeat protein
MSSLSRLHRKRGQLDEASAMHNEVVLRYKLSHGERDERVGNAAAELCIIERLRKKRKEAIAACTLSLDALKSGPDPRNYAYALTHAALLDLQLGNAKQAKDRAFEALALREANASEKRYDAETRYVAAAALLALGEDTERATVLANQALSTMRAAPAGDQYFLPELENLVEQHKLDITSQPVVEESDEAEAP